MIDSFLDTESDDYDFMDDEDIELYDDEFDEDYDEFEADDYIPDFWSEYEDDLIDDLPELAEVLREAVHDRYQDASPEEMEEALLNMLDEMTPAEGFNFTSAVRQIGKAGQGVLKDPTVGKIAGTALPVAGGALGTVVGGPIGTAMGAKLGQAAVQAFPGAKKPVTPPQAAPITPSAQLTVGTPQGGSTAAAQLLQLTQNPVMLQSLLALALGEHGRKSIPMGLGGQAVQPGPMMNLISQLAGKAAEDADQLLWESEDTPAYLFNREGEYVVDPAVPQDHAEALYEALLTAENQAFLGENVVRQPWSNYLPFPVGTKLLVEYETIIRNFDIGNGSVLERTADLFKAKIHIDKWDRFNIPETYIMLMIDYKQDGSGNKAMVSVNGKQYSDNNVTIRSGKNARDILMSIDFLGQKIDQISIKSEGANKAKLKFNAGGDKHVLILTKK